MRRTIRFVVIICTSVVTLLTAMSVGFAQQPASVRNRRTVQATWREVFRTTENHVMPIEGFDGRGIGVMEQRGLAFFEDEVASIVVWFTYAYHHRDSTYQGYARYTFADGATIGGSFAGAGPVPGRQTGTITLLQGTGRFDGIQGKATFTAVTVTPGAAGGDTYVDATGQYTLPVR